MTTLPTNCLRLSSKWLETNPLPEDAYCLSLSNTMPSGGWFESSWRGKMLPEWAIDEFIYATARTDLPRDAYADDEIRPMTHEERKALDEFTMKELRSEPVAEVAIERAEDRPRSPLVGVTMKRMDEQSRELATLRTQLEAKEAECRELREENAVLKSQVENADINLQQVHLTQKGIWRTKVESAEKEITRLTADLDAVRKERYAVVEKFRKAEEWNKLTELELKNLRSLNSDLSQDIDSIDMLRDEFRRIASCPDATEEIKGLCKRALQDIKQRVPVIKQRDTAIADRDRLAVRVRGLLKTLEPYVKLVDRPKHVCGQYLGLATNSLYAYAVNEFYKAKEAVEKLLTPSQQPDNFDSSGSANPSEHQPNALAGWAHAVTGEQPREYCGASEHKPQGNGKQERDLPAVNPSRPEPVIAGELHPFDLARALAGDRVVTRDGRMVAGIKITGLAMVRGILDEKPQAWGRSGSWYCGETNSSNDLFMADPPPPIAPEGKATEGEG